MQPVYKSKVLASASTTAVCASQTPLAGGNLTINGGSATGGVATLDTQRVILLSFASSETGRTFVVYGTDDGGTRIQESVAGAASTAVTTQSFKTVTRITIDAASAGAITVGTNGVGATPWQIISNAVSPVNLGIGVTVSGTVDFTWQYTFEDPSGTWPNPATQTTSGYVDAGQPNTLTKFPTAWPLSALAAKSANTDSSMTTPIYAWRLQINSGSGSAQAVVVQAGIQGG
jgi:hypothetical protein